MSSEGRAFDWDDEIQKDSDFTVLPEGEYAFEVKDFERARHPGSEKLPPCNKAIIHLKVFGGDDLGDTTVKHNLFLHEKTEGMISAFFSALGMKKHGEKLKMEWNKTIGRTGRAKIKIRKYEGNEYNEIANFIKPKSENASSGRSYTDGEF
jgi:hypothetical protein